MYRTLLSCALIATGLTACTPTQSDEAILEATCNELFGGDSAIADRIVGTTAADVPAFCSCYGSVTAEDETQAALHKQVLAAIVAQRAADGSDLEAAVRALDDQIRAGSLTTFTSEQLVGTGEDFRDIAERMFDNDGDCTPVS